MSPSADKSPDDASLGDEQRVVAASADSAGEQGTPDADAGLDGDLGVDLGADAGVDADLGADLDLGAGAGVEDPFADTADWFSAELENVSASDWDIDTTELWGGDGGYEGADGGAESGFDLPM